MGKKIDFKRLVIEYALIFASAFCYAFALYFFVFANPFTNGGIAGIVAMIDYLIGTDVYGGYINFAINVPLIILALFALNRNFTIKTVVHIFFVSAFLAIFPLLGETGMAQYEGGDDIGRNILAAIYGGVLAGVALALVFYVKGSTGGADILGMLIQKKNPACRVQWGIFIVNCVIIGISAIVFSYNPKEGEWKFDIDSLQPVMLAFIYQFISAKVCDLMTQGPKTALKIEVVTDNPEELSAEILTKLKHGVTVVPAKGMYENKDRNLLICVVSKRQMRDFKDILKKYDNTFAYVAPVNEIIGSFNNRKKL